MTDASPSLVQPAASSPGSGWRELWTKEDWWAVWLGLGLVVVAYGLFASGSSIGWLAVAPSKWSDFSQLAAHFRLNAIRYLVQFVILLGLFSGAASPIGYRARDFAKGFVLIYLLSLIVFSAGTWDRALYYNLAPPLQALAGGLTIDH